MKRPTLQEIRSAANILFGVDIALKTRKREIIRKRQIAHYVAHVKFRYSSARTGAILGGKDHATVLHSCKVISNEIALYDDIISDVRRLTNMCKSKGGSETPISIITGLIESKSVDVNVKIELRAVLKLLSYESN